MRALVSRFPGLSDLGIPWQGSLSGVAVRSLRSFPTRRDTALRARDRLTLRANRPPRHRRLGLGKAKQGLPTRNCIPSLLHSGACRRPPGRTPRQPTPRTHRVRRDDRQPESPSWRDGETSSRDSAWRGTSPPPGSAGSGLTRRVSGLRASDISFRLPTRRDSSTQIFFGRLPCQ